MLQNMKMGPQREKTEESKWLKINPQDELLHAGYEMKSAAKLFKRSNRYSALGKTWLPTNKKTLSGTNNLHYGTRPNLFVARQKVALQHC
jgi:hypothetical protein